MSAKNKDRGYCLVSQQIRDEIIAGKIRVNTLNLSLDRKKRFSDAGLEKRIQPSSFEPVIGDEIFILDIEKQAVFCPGSSQTVYRALLELPRRQRQKMDISEGFETITGFNYLIPLVERLKLEDNEDVRSSPKSSVGRLFPYTRLVSDFSSSFDQIHHQNVSGREIQMWLLFQPTAFNIIIHPGLTLNQLRFFRGANASLSQQELIEEFHKNPFLYDRMPDGSFKLIKSLITNDGLQMNIDLSGQYTRGIVALRARRNPVPIDLSLDDFYDAEDFFEPVLASKGKVRLYGGEKYLIASKGVLKIPKHLSAELRRHSGISIRGSWDEAGFCDNGFTGDLNFEATMNESGGMTLDANSTLPVSFLEFFRTIETPDKIYGKKIGSHYQGQLGTHPPKYFRKFDFSRAAKDYKKLDRDVLVHDSRLLRAFRQDPVGFEPISPEKAAELIKEIEENGFFHSRYDCENDYEVLQVIPYTIVFGPDKTVFSYVRSDDIREYGDERLFGKHSIGFGGHIVRSDEPSYVSNGQRREFLEEVKITGECSKPRIIGTLYAEDRDVDKVHFGLVYTIHLNGRLKPNEKSGKSFKRESFDEISKKVHYFETWSRILIPYLQLLYGR